MGLLGDQRKIDVDKDGEITGKDFEMLREQRMSGGLLDDDMGRLALAEGPKDDGGLRRSLIIRDAMSVIKENSYDDVNLDQVQLDLTENMEDISAFRERHKPFNRFLSDKESKEALLYTLQNRDKILEREPKVFGGLARAAAKGAKSLFKQGKSKEVKDLEKFLQDDKYGDLTMSFTKKELDDEFKLSNNDPAYLEYLREAASIKANDYEYIIKGKAMGLSDEEIKTLLKKSDKEIKKQLNIREQKAEGGEMLPDEMMEQNFVDFVVDEALSPEEKSMLEEQLEANPQLSVLFDKVVETASEFTGAGPVEGPGTGTSDDIPARLSDGEFVFTAKAVEQLGADNLMKMMKDAEAAYDAGGQREAMQEGGLTSVEEEENPMTPKKVEVEYTINRPAANVVSGVNPLLAAQEEQDLIDEELKKRMIGITPYVRS